MLTCYSIVNESGQCVCLMRVRDSCVDYAPEVIAYVRRRPFYEARTLLEQHRLRAVVEEIWVRHISPVEVSIADLVERRLSQS